MLRSLIFTALLNINPAEFSGLTMDESSAMITDVVDALESLPSPCADIFQWCGEYDKRLTPSDGFPGYYKRYVACLMVQAEKIIPE